MTPSAITALDSQVNTASVLDSADSTSGHTSQSQAAHMALAAANLVGSRAACTVRRFGNARNAARRHLCADRLRR